MCAAVSGSFWFRSFPAYSFLTFVVVYRLNHPLGPVLAYTRIPVYSPDRHSRRCLPRANAVHARRRRHVFTPPPPLSLSSPTLTTHRYAEAKELGIFQEVGEHEFAGVNAGEIMGRILKQRELYEERQRRKGVKAIDEDDMVN